MQVLDECDYCKVIAVLKQVPINTFFAQVIANKTVASGTIFVDDLVAPSTFYIVHPYGMSLLFGSTFNSNFNSALCSYLLNKSNVREKVEWLQVYPVYAWSQKIQDLVGPTNNLITKASLQDFALDNNEEGKIVLNTRVNFKFNLEKYQKFKQELMQSPSYLKEYKIEKMNEETYPKEGSVIPRFGFLKFFFLQLFKDTCGIIVKHFCETE